MRIGHALNAAVVDNGTHVRGTQRTSEVQRINGGPQTQIAAAPAFVIYEYSNSQMSTEHPK